MAYSESVPAAVGALATAGAARAATRRAAVGARGAAAPVRGV
jgi:hypothetical protein